MRIDRAQLIAAGKALKDVADREQVERVTVNGKEVKHLHAAEKALEHADQALVPTGPGLMDRLTRKLEHGVDHLEAKLNKTKAGRLTARLLRSDAERVTHRSTVEITFKGGRTVQIPVEVVDARLTSFLQRSSIVAESLGIIPIFGFVFLGATSLAAGVASVVSLVRGDKDLARALGRVSAKHAVVGAFAAVPGIGEVVPALAAGVDVANLKGALTAPSVASIVNLRQYAQQPPE